MCVINPPNVPDIVRLCESVKTEKKGPENNGTCLNNRPIKVRLNICSYKVILDKRGLALTNSSDRDSCRIQIQTCDHEVRRIDLFH